MRNRMAKVARLFQILHIAALGLMACVFGLSMWAWLNGHVSAAATTLKDLSSLGGLALGFGLGVVLVWDSARSAPTSIKRNVILYVGWIGVFAWYWFNRFAGPEIHSLAPQGIRREQVQHFAVSTCFFLLWVGLYLTGPVLKARRHRQTALRAG
jgi:hypothetical protein